MPAPPPDAIAKAQALRNELLEDLKRLRALFQSGRDISKRSSDPVLGAEDKKPIRPPAKSPELLYGGRNYYKDVFGFDPVQARIKTRGGAFKYEQFFPLKADIELDREGITIGARVEFKQVEFNKPERPIRNRIVFRKGKMETQVACVHTALFTLDATEALIASDEQLVDLARCSERENEPIKLPPEEHFVSLRSYVEGIAMLGIRNIIGASYYSEKINPDTLPFGFNSAMQKQIIQALHQLAPSATKAIVRDVLIELAQAVPEDWFDLRISLLDQIYNLKEIVLTDPAVFDAVDQAAHSENLRRLAFLYPLTDHQILDRLKNDPHYEEYRKTITSRPLQPPTFIFKITILGTEGSGRNSLCKRLSAHFNDPLARSMEYIGQSFGFREFHYPQGQTVRLLLCDFSGEARFQYLLPDYSLGVAGAFICYDLTNAKSLDSVHNWIELIRDKNDLAPIFLVGCKADLDPKKRVIDEATATKVATDLGCVRAMITSAVTGLNCEEMLRDMADLLFKGIRITE